MDLIHRFRWLVSALILGMLVGFLPQFSLSFSVLGGIFALLMSFSILGPRSWMLELAGSLAASLAFLVLGQRFLENVTQAWWPAAVVWVVYVAAGLLPLVESKSTQRLFNSITDLEHSPVSRILIITAIVILWLLRTFADAQPHHFEFALAIVLTVIAALLLRSAVHARMNGTSASPPN